MAKENLNIVFIYQQLLHDFYEPHLTELCVDSWRRHGWRVITTTLADAKMHPQWDNLGANKKHLTLGQEFPDRIMVSYYKWLAWSNNLSYFGDDVQWTIATDFDVINYGFTPAHAQVIRNACGDQRLIVLGEYGYSFDKEPYLRPPTPVIAPSPPLVDNMIDLFVEYNHNGPQTKAAIARRPKGALAQRVDEQSLINDVFWGDYIRHSPCCPMYGAENFESVPWREACLVHYTNWSVAKKHTLKRYQTIMKERPPL